MTKKYIVIIKHKEEIIGRQMFDNLTNVKASVDLVEQWNPEYEFEIFKIAKLAKYMNVTIKEALKIL